MTRRKVKFVKIFADFSNAALPPDRKVASFCDTTFRSEYGKNTVKNKIRTVFERDQFFCSADFSLFAFFAQTIFHDCINDYIRKCIHN